MKQYEGLISYLTNIILRPHRETYGVQKLGPSKIVVKSHEKSISMLESMSKNEKHLPKQMQQNYCELIQVNRKEVTIKRECKNIQVSIYEPQLTSIQNINTEDHKNTGQSGNKNVRVNNFPNIKYPNEIKYQNCVIFLHANSGSRLEGTQYAKHVLQYRTLCVSFDYTGSGISQGQYTTMGVNQSKDLSTVINYIAETYKVKKFSLWGRSMGAVTGIYYLLTKYKQDVTKIRVTSCVIDSPFSHLQQLIKELASRKSSLPQFIFQPILKIIENDIINKVGVNIFTQLNLIDKIKSLSQQEKRLINSVSFLGLASKDDTMINHQHCEQLCSLLISEDARRSDLIDDKNYLVSNSYDKHLMMLVEFKKQINTKGDFLEIQGEHNKPRSNEVKQKVSFFIQDNFYSFKDFQLPTINPIVNQQKQNKISFSKTGVSIKTKLSFAKNGLVKPRKDSTTISQSVNEQNIKQQSFSRHNYNLINLKEIKAKQTKQSLSKQKQSIRNSLNKNFLFKDRKDYKQGVQTAKSIESGKGINIVSKEFHRERINPTEQSSKVSKKAYETLQNSKNFSTQLQPQRKKIFQQNSHFSSFLAKLKGENLSRNQNQSNTKQIQKSPINSDQSGSVNNSIKKLRESSIEKKRQNIVVSPLQLSENVPIMNAGHNLTQRPVRTERIFESLPSDRVIRNNRTQPDIYANVLNQSPVVNTSPFNLSVENRSNLSISVRESTDEPFRKKDTSQIMQETGLSVKKQGSKTPQVKISISEFRNRQQQGVKSVNKRIEQVIVKKQSNSNDINTTGVWSQSNTINMLQSTQSIYSQDKLSSKNSIQFKKRQPAQTNSIHNSDMSYQESFDYNRVQNGHNRSFLQSRRQQSNTKNGFYMNNQVNNQKPPSVSNSFTQQTNTVSIKQMMINSGHKGMTQSSTFNYNQPNAFYQPIYPNQQPYPNTSYQYVNQGGNYQPQQNYVNDKNMQSNNQFYSNQTQNKMYMANTKSMKTSQDPTGQDFNRIKEYSSNKVTMSAIQPNAFQQYNYQNQQTSYMMNSTNPNFWYVPQQGVKQTIQYKKKINKLLD